MDAIIRLSGSGERGITIMPATVVRWGGLAAVLVGVFALITELLDLYLYATTSEDSFSEVATSATFAVQGVFLSCHAAAGGAGRTIR